MNNYNITKINSSPIDTEDKKHRLMIGESATLGLTGLTNTGNTCFINTVI